MKFLKDNFHDILKLYINQIGIVIFTLALLFPMQSLGGEDGTDPIWDVLASVLATVFYFVLLYYAVWEIGAKDKIRVDSGRYSATPAKGAMLGLFANIPNLVLSVPLLVFSVIYVTSGKCLSVFSVLKLITHFHEAMYMGTVLGVTGFNNNYSDPIQILVSVLFVLVPLLSVAVTHFAYTLGSREKRLLGFLSSKPKK